MVSFCLQELSHELDMKVKKYLRGEGADLEVRNWCSTFPVEEPFLFRGFFFNCILILILPIYRF